MRGRGLINTNAGWVQVLSNANPIRSDTRWSFNNFSFIDLGFKSPSFRSTTSGATATFTSTHTGTVVEFVITGAWGSYTYAIDGGAAVPVAAGGSINGGAVKTTVSSLSNVVHSLVITSTSTTPVYVAKARVRSASGIYLHNAGWGGSRSEEWDTTSNANSTWQLYSLQPTAFSGITQPNLVIFDVSMWVNDIMLASWTPAQTIAALTRIIGQFRTRGADVLMVTTTAPNPAAGFSPYAAITDAQYRGVRQALYQIADATDTPLVDVPYRHGDWPEANTNGLMADAIHPNASGYAGVARAVDAVL
jgi:lysophospholipase L1-like esterase